MPQSHQVLVGDCLRRWGQRAPAALVAALLLVVGATSAWADENAPWTAETLDPAQIEASASATETALAAIPAETEDSVAKAQREFLVARQADLRALLSVLTRRRETLSPADVEARRVAAETAYRELTTRDPAKGQVAAAAEVTEALVQTLTQEREAVLAAERASKEAVVAVAAAKPRYEATLRDQPEQLASVRQALTTPAGSDTAAQEARTNLRLRERLLVEQLAWATDRLAQNPALLSMHNAELQVHAKRLEQLDAELELARSRRQVDLEGEAERTRAAAEAASAAAEAETDPAARFRKRIAAREQDLEAEARGHLRDAAQREAEVEAAERTVKILTEDLTLLRERLALERETSQEAADALIKRLERYNQLQRRLLRTALPGVAAQLRTNEDQRAKLDDRIWELRSPKSENTLFQALVDDLGGDTERAQQLWSEEVEGPDNLLLRLMDAKQALDTPRTLLRRHERSLREQLSGADALISLVMGRIYFLRTAPALGLHDLTAAGHELGGIVGALQAPPARGLLRTAPTGLAGWGGALGLLLATLGAWLVGRTTRRKEPAPNVGDKAGEAVDKTPAPVVASPARFARARPLLDLMGALGRASWLPLALLVLAQVMASLSLPGRWLEVAASGLRIAAAFVWARGLARHLLSATGPLVEYVEMPEAVATALRRLVRFVSAAGLALWLPRQLLRAAPFELTHLPRLLMTVFLALVAVAGLRLVRPRGPLALHLRSRTPLLHRIWPMLVILAAIALIGVVVMDVLGYRLGAETVLDHVVRTALVLLGLTLMHGILRRVVGGLVDRVHTSRLAEGMDPSEGREEAHLVGDQLTRLSMVAVSVLAVLVLADAWHLDTAARSFLSQFEMISGDPATSLWDVFRAVAWIALAHILVANVGATFEALLAPLIAKGRGGGLYVLLTFIRYGVILMAYMAALRALHVSFSSIGWLLAAASVGLGFGLQEIVANFVSGIILLLERPVRAGDTITIGDSWGVVDRITVRSTIVTDRDDQQVIIPNKSFITEQVVNWSRNGDLIRRKVEVGVAYGTDVASVLKVLRQAVRAHPRVARRPSPEILFLGFGDSSLDFAVRFHTPIRGFMQVLSDVNVAIERALKNEGIEIPFPQRDLHIRSSSVPLGGGSGFTLGKSAADGDAAEAGAPERAPRSDLDETPRL